MALEGDIVVTLAWDGRRVQRARVRSTRPDVVERVLHERTPRECIDLVTRLHAICGTAQGAAASAALEAATDADVAMPVVAARAAAVRLEIVHEHVMRLGIDWARAMGTEPLTACVTAVRSVLLPALATLSAHGIHRGASCDAAAIERGTLQAITPHVEHALLGMPALRWLAQDGVDAVDEWSRTPVAPARWYAALRGADVHLGASDVPMMPAVTPHGVRAAVLPAWTNARAFRTCPTWAGDAVETGVLARMRDHPVVSALIERDGSTVASRLIARLTELASLIRAEDAACSVLHEPVVAFATDGAGVALAHTARGLLMHRVRVEHALTADYSILAPTEWNFREDGAFARAAHRIAGATEQAIERDARLVALAMDPCVGCRVEVMHA